MRELLHKLEKKKGNAEIRIFQATGGRYNFDVRASIGGASSSLVERGKANSAKGAFDGAMQVCRKEFDWR